MDWWDQFTILLLALSLATVCLTMARRSLLLIFLCYVVLMSAYGNRSPLLTITLVALSAMVRYGIKVPLRTFLPLG